MRAPKKCIFLVDTNLPSVGFIKLRYEWSENSADSSQYSEGVPEANDVQASSRSLPMKLLTNELRLKLATYGPHISSLFNKSNKLEESSALLKWERLEPQSQTWLEVTTGCLSLEPSTRLVQLRATFDLSVHEPLIGKQTARANLCWRTHATQQNGFLIGGHKIQIQEQPNAGSGTGYNIWDGALILSKYMEQEMKANRLGVGGLAGKRVLELGSGTGLAGLAAAVLGAQEVVLTDLPYAVGLLEHNVNLNMDIFKGQNKNCPISVQVLDWESISQRFTLGHRYNGPQFDYIIGSDIVWLKHLILPLVRTLAYFCSPPPSSSSPRSLQGNISTSSGDKRSVQNTSPRILIAHQTRSQDCDRALLQNLAEQGFKWTTAQPSSSTCAISIYDIEFSMG